MRASTDNVRGSIALGVFAGVLWLSWQGIRLPLLALLKILEPLVSTLLAAAALLGTLTALFWRFVADRPHFPFFGVLALSVGCFLLLSLYHGAIRLLSGGTSGR